MLTEQRYGYRLPDNLDQRKGEVLVGVGAYAYYDTARVGKSAIELFSSNIE
jgi:hypothetical protein